MDGEKVFEATVRFRTVGDMTGFTGVDDPYEALERAELAIRTEMTGIDEAVGLLLGVIGE